MQFRFLHIADVHLGKHQHESEERYADYFRVLAGVVEYAIGEQVQALLIAGDLFDEQDPSAESIRRAMTALRPLRETGIPVYAIEGNHDRRKRTEPACALDILAGESYLHLLRPDIENGTLTLRDYSEEKGGSLLRPVKDVVIAGLGFLGHHAEEYHRQAAEQLPEDAFPIVLSHVMVQPGEETLEYGCVAYDDIAALQERIGYLALGHRHTRTGIDGEMDGWVYNPGSLEFVNSLDYRLPPELRGFYDVTVADTGEGPGKSDAAMADDISEVRLQRLGYHLRVRHVPTRKRPAHTLRVDISGCDTPARVIDAVRRVAEEEVNASLREQHPILIARLQGTLALSRSRIPRSGIAAMLAEEFSAMHVEVMDRDLLGSSDVGTLLADAGDLELLTDRARAVASTLLRDQGIAVGREDALAAVLIDMKTQLQGGPAKPRPEALKSLQSQLLPFVEYEEEVSTTGADDTGDTADSREREETDEAEGSKE
ncbi:DNA repair exonuclease [bacterium]|nr:DNA repair exonuclease [bacterium]